MALANLFAEVGKIRPRDDRDAAIYGETYSKLDELLDFRRDRIIESQTGVPLILWAIGLVGSFLTVSYSSAFSPTRYNMLMISGISVAFGLVFLFILIVDHPFKDEFSVSNRQLVELSSEFDQLDRVGATRPRR